MLDGNGKLCFENDFVEFEKGDSVLINSNEKYYWDTTFCVVTMTCTPAWNEEQHKLVQ
ncbi:MAG: hypothetical protein K2M17_03575 [Bacilli bacterium]|nr:hypothetical protein [Bacilli bacterium]